eukprot:CAMPEP_0194044448 /NCGR_PEP_ID=MMETSP0009_2-20130614/15916_1 /TAXON_ID=210454 /ORGANISM="Grammatophora oceanica, Strain CCMP 410" /LENGTH=433 /DNA_ID=CAMNT_0038688973 /DNA_START=164 /DNA_END=1462 /DNA_ORIENTATION=+
MSQETPSPGFLRALQKIQGLGFSLDDLPANREATDWDVIAEEASLERFEVVALKTHREQQHHQQQQQVGTLETWYRVTGAISRPSIHAGARYSLFRFAASDGLYPEGLNSKSAFEPVTSTREETNILKFSVVFQSLNSAAKFLDSLASYLKQARGMMHFCDDEGNEAAMPSMESIAPFPIESQNKILLAHYQPCDGDGDAAPDSPVVDVVCDTRSDNITVDVTILSRRDEVFQYQRIENSSAFALADPEGAHIFPRAKCVGQYEWLDDKPFNRLALSRDLHLNFDGTGRGRGKRRKTVQTIAIRPLRNPNGYAILQIDGVDCYEIQIEIVINDNTKAEPILTRLQNHAQLNRNENERWTIAGADLRLLYPRNRRIDLILDGAEEPTELVTAVPGVDDLSDCWSNSPQNLYSLEAAEILEKCLCWNYEEAMQTW